MQEGLKWALTHSVVQYFGYRSHCKPGWGGMGLQSSVSRAVRERLQTSMQANWLLPCEDLMILLVNITIRLGNMSGILIFHCLLLLLLLWLWKRSFNLSLLFVCFAVSLPSDPTALSLLSLEGSPVETWVASILLRTSDCICLRRR